MIKDDVVSATEVSRRLKKHSSDEIEKQSHRQGKYRESKGDQERPTKSTAFSEGGTDCTNKSVSKEMEFRNWLNLNGYHDVLKKYNEIFD